MARPGYVLARERTIAGMLPRSICVDELAAAMVDMAEKGSESQTVNNNALRERGRLVLKRSS